MATALCTLVLILHPDQSLMDNAPSSLRLSWIPKD